MLYCERRSFLSRALQFLYQCSYSMEFAVWHSDWHNSTIVVTRLYSYCLEYTVFSLFWRRQSCLYNRKRKKKKKHNCHEINFRCAYILVTFQLFVSLYESTEKMHFLLHVFTHTKKKGNSSQVAFFKVKLGSEQERN